MKPVTVVLVLIAHFCVVPALFAKDFMKCGTPEALRAFWAGEKLERPPFGQDTVSSRHFIVHFDTTGEHATDRAYAESVSVYAEYSWHVQMDSLGWIAPPPDGSAGGDSLYDIYIRQLDPGVLGDCSPEADYWDPYPSGKTSFMRIQRDLSRDAARATVSHEFNHASQFRYNGQHTNVGTWWYENTAKWMEDVCFDDVNHFFCAKKCLTILLIFCIVTEKEA